jgi:hypothetical protein
LSRVSTFGLPWRSSPAGVCGSYQAPGGEHHHTGPHVVADASAGETRAMLVEYVLILTTSATGRTHDSMSGKGNCYDNACVEGFFHSMKIEAVHGERFTTRQATRQEVFEYIETFYNTIRQHSTLGCISPETFEARSVA